MAETLEARDLGDMSDEEREEYDALVAKQGIFSDQKVLNIAILTWLQALTDWAMQSGWELGYDMPDPGELGAVDATTALLEQMKKKGQLPDFCNGKAELPRFAAKKIKLLDQYGNPIE